MYCHFSGGGGGYYAYGGGGVREGEISKYTYCECEVHGHYVYMPLVQHGYVSTYMAPPHAGHLLRRLEALHFSTI